MTSLNPVLVIIGGLIALAALGYLYFKITIYEQIKSEERQAITGDPTEIRARAEEVFIQKFDYFCRKHDLFYQPMITVGDREEPGEPIKPWSKRVSVPQSLAAYNIEIPPSLVRATDLSWPEAEGNLRRIAGEIQSDSDVKVYKPAGQTAYRVEVYTKGYGD